MPVLPVKRTYLLHSAFTKLIKHFGKKLMTIPRFKNVELQD